MSYAVPPPPKQRPSVVNTAAILLWVVVAAQVVSLILAFIPNEELDRAIEQFNADHPNFEEQSQAIFAVAGIVGIALTAVIGVGLGVLAVFVRRGNQPARIVTWVLGGIYALCQVCGLAGNALPTMQTGGQTDGPGSEPEEFARLIEEHTPAWLTTANTLLMIVALAGLLGAIILLALPVSNDYFRKPAEVWVPPTAYPGGGLPPAPPPGTPQNPMAPPPPPPAPPSQQ